MRCALLIALVIAGAPPVVTAQAQADSVRITSVTPDGPVTRGVPVMVTVAVDIVLASADSATVRAGLNFTAPDGWRMSEVARVARGRHRTSFTIRAIPVDWGQMGRYQLRIALTTSPPAGQPPSSLASDRRLFVVRP